MELNAIPKLMVVCLALIHSTRLVTSVETKKSSNPTPQTQSKTTSATTSVSQQSSASVASPSGTATASDSKPQPGSSPTSSQPKTQSTSKPSTPGTPAVTVSQPSESTPTKPASSTPSTPGTQQAQPKPVGTKPADTKTEVTSPKPKESSSAPKANQSAAPEPKTEKDTKIQEKREPIEVNIKLKKGTENYDYSYDKNTKTATFEAKQGYGFNSVLQDKTEIWKASSDSEYSTKIMTDGEGPSSKTVSIYLLNETVKNFTKSGKNWTERSELLDLNIKDTKTTYEFDFQKDDPSKTNTYLTKHGFKFNVVKHDKTEVWKASSDSEHSAKVEVKLDGSKPRNVVVHLKDGTMKTYIKLDDKWFETPVAITVDISKSSNTDAFNVSKDKKLNTYTPKAGVEFNVVKQKDVEIWKADTKSEYSTKVELQDLRSNKADLTLYPTNNTRKTFHKPGKKDPWTETTPLKVAILTLSDKNGNIETNDSNKFSMKEESDGLYSCKFKPGAKCVEFKLNNKTVWKHDKNEHGEHYLLELIFKLDEISLKVLNMLLKYSYENNQWNLKSKTLFDSSTNKFFTLVTSKNEDNSNTSENDFSHFDVTSHSIDQFIIFFGDDVKFLELKYDQQSIWKHSIDKYGDEYPGSIIHKPGDFLCLDYHPYYYVYNYDSSNDKWVLNDKLSHKALLPLDVSEHPSYFTVITENDDKQPVQNDTTKYKVLSSADGIYLYSFNEGTKCVEIFFRGTSIWKLNSPRRPENLPKIISVDTVGSVFEIEFKDKTLGYKLTEEGVINYTVKNDKTHYSKALNLFSNKGSSSPDIAKSAVSGVHGNPPSAPNSSYRAPPPVPPLSQESSSSFRAPPPVPPTAPGNPAEPKSSEDSKPQPGSSPTSSQPKTQSTSKPSTPGTPAVTVSQPSESTPTKPASSTPSTPGTQQAQPKPVGTKPADTKTEVTSPKPKESSSAPKSNQFVSSQPSAVKESKPAEESKASTPSTPTSSTPAPAKPTSSVSGQSAVKESKDQLSQVVSSGQSQPTPKSVPKVSTQSSSGTSNQPSGKDSKVSTHKSGVSNNQPDSKSLASSQQSSSTISTPTPKASQGSLDSKTQSSGQSQPKPSTTTPTTSFPPSSASVASPSGTATASDFKPQPGSSPTSSQKSRSTGPPTISSQSLSTTSHTPPSQTQRSGSSSTTPNLGSSPTSSTATTIPKTTGQTRTVANPPTLGSISTSKPPPIKTSVK